MQSEQINEIAAALAKAQGEMSNAVMNRTNPHFKSKYADMASVLDAIRKPLAVHGIAFSQAVEIRQGGQVLVTKLIHSSGQWLGSEFPLPTTARIQEMGSALTYARRYSLAAIVCNSADEDDDANTAEKNGQTVNANGKSKSFPQPVSSRQSADQPRPVDPAPPPGGEAIDPHPIPVPLTADGGGSDWVTWGKAYIDAVRTAMTIDVADAWAAANDTPAATMQEAAPKVYARMIAAVAQHRGKLVTGANDILMAG